MKTAQIFFHQLIKLYRPFEKGLNDQLKKHQLHRAQWTILYHLYNMGPTTNVQLTHYLGVEKPTITRTFASLDQLGYIEQSTGTDRREKWMQLTQQGKNVYEQARVSIDQFEKEILQGVSVEDQKEMIQMMKAIRSNIIK